MISHTILTDAQSYIYTHTRNIYARTLTHVHAYTVKCKDKKHGGITVYTCATMMTVNIIIITIIIMVIDYDYYYYKGDKKKRY